jgi:MerR family transcriptional regulator, redox-sensitive transcriptional activator SoxR
MTKDLTISEVAQQAGLRTSAIRYYESVNLLPTPKRVSGQRRYSPDVLRRLSFIQVAQAAGFTLAEMQTLFNGLNGGEPLSERWRTLARKKMSEVDALILRAYGMKTMLENGLNCGCLSLDECIDCVLINCQPPQLISTIKKSEQ